jgi:hypothetical protein
VVSTTSWPRWAARLTSWAATTCLAVLAYVACAGAVYLATVRQATWGGPLWWPVAVGAATVAMACAAGFAAGVLLPSRFTASLTAIVVLAALLAALRPLGASSCALLSPVNATLGLNLFADIGVFYSYPPDLAIVQLLFAAGIAAIALGALGLPRASGGPWLRRTAAVVTAAGLAAAGTAAGLAGTARLDAHDVVVVPALHDAASDQPLAYVPVCGAGAIPVCVHPAFRGYLPELTAALRPVFSVVAGLPGAPVSVTQQPRIFHLNSAGFLIPQIDAVTSGNPPVIGLPLDIDAGPRDPALSQSVMAEAAPAIVAGVTGVRLVPAAGPGVLRMAGTPAQQAVTVGLLQAAGVALLTPTEAASGTGPGDASLVLKAGSAVCEAGMRFAALSAAAHHAWLLTHLSALRAGRVTLAQLP